MTCAEARDILRNARNKALPIRAETCPHYLSLNAYVYSGDEGEKFVCSPPIRSEGDSQALWGITSDQVGLLGTFTFGGMALGSLIAGILGDKVGRRTTYMYNLALYTLGALIGAFAPNIETLLIGRLIVGIGLGGELNTGLTIVSEFVPTKQRGSSTAIVNVAAGGLGIFLSSALSFLMLGPLMPFFGGETRAWRFPPPRGPTL